jgi:hypothetical protein
MTEPVELVILTPAEVSAFIDGELSRDERSDVVTTTAPPACSKPGNGSWRSFMRRLAASLTSRCRKGLS